MDKMNLSRIFIAASVFILSILLVNGRIATAGHQFGLSLTPFVPTPRIIMILDSRPGKNVIPVEPDKLWIDRFTEVTWINASQTDIRIKFGKGTNCREVSTSAFPGLGSRLDSQKCVVVSNSIPVKGKLWFRFEEPGDYRYQVEYQGGNEKVSGEIKVF